MHGRFLALRESLPSFAKSKIGNRLWHNYTRGNYSQEVSAVDSSLQNARDTDGAKENGTLNEQYKYWESAYATLLMYSENF